MVVFLEWRASLARVVAARACTAELHVIGADRDVPALRYRFILAA
jgi:hypothetical protein